MSIFKSAMFSGAVFAMAITSHVAVTVAQETPPTGIQPAAVAETMDENEAVKKASFLVGYNAIGKIISDMKQQGIELDPEMVVEGATKAARGEAPGVDPAEMQQVMLAMRSKVEKARGEMQEKMKAAAQDNLAAGKTFMEENAAKSGVQTMDNGVQYEVITEGSGDKAAEDDMVKINYHGTLVDGTVFDSSIEEIRGKQPKPITHSASGFVPGFNSVVQSMPVGSKWKVVIPPDLAYGLQGPMGPNQTLVFEIELLDVVSGDAPAAP